MVHSHQKPTWIAMITDVVLAQEAVLTQTCIIIHTNALAPAREHKVFRAKPTVLYQRTKSKILFRSQKKLISFFLIKY